MEALSRIEKQRIEQEEDAPGAKVTFQCLRAKFIHPARGVPSSGFQRAVWTAFLNSRFSALGVR